eukprot:TRINITY_DN38616_c0_g1_i1.p1 TRINITY_DN38616_c0_g1~~TRINITY_DN38616_c0_g1_i1.p1  ORF type:complete len:375 (-),score=45.22 TRINITY_DN38616_c0_g1_i1:164-1288(-)
MQQFCKQIVKAAVQIVNKFFVLKILVLFGIYQKNLLNQFISVNMSLTQEKYDPFRRSDTYGDMGYGKLSFYEQFRLTIFGLTLFPIRFILLVGFIFWFYLVCIFSKLFLSGAKRRKLLSDLGKVACGWMLYCIGFTEVRWIQLSKQQNEQINNNNNQVKLDGRYAGIVCNHVGWPDIFVLFARFFPAFLARAGTESIPVVGAVCDVMGCMYIEREKKNSGQPGMAERLKQKMEIFYNNPEQCYNPVLVFPEGTTTNNKFLLQFKSGAFLAGLPLQLVVLKYEVGRVSAAWESIGALRHLFLMFSNPCNKVTCYELPIYYPDQKEKEDARLYANNVRQRMLEVGQFISSNSTLEDKRQYHALLKEKNAKLNLKKE